MKRNTMGLFASMHWLRRTVPGISWGMVLNLCVRHGIRFTDPNWKEAD